MKDFTTGSIPRHLIKFLVPLLLANMLQAAYMLIDAFWAGRLTQQFGSPRLR
jgi:Na+-driven multidrug efflux pump